MNTCLAVMAHNGVEKTLADFQPRWQTLGKPILGFVPEGHDWPGSPVTQVYRIGKSAHSGNATFQRFIATAEKLLETDYDSFVLMEYDTVNLVDRMPYGLDWNKLNCGVMPTYELGCPGGNFIIALSPWIISRRLLPSFLSALRRQLVEPIHGEWINGLLDRFISVAVVASDLPVQNIVELMPFPFPHLDPLKAIVERSFTWAHGYKRASDFKHLWPTQK